MRELFVLVAILVVLGCRDSASTPSSIENLGPSEIFFPTVDYPHSADLSPTFGHIQVYNGRDSDSDLQQNCVLAIIALYPGFVSDKCEVQHSAGDVMTTVTKYKYGTETFTTDICWDRRADTINIGGRLYSRGNGRIFLIYKEDAISESEILQLPGPPMGNSPAHVLAAIKTLANTGRVYPDKERVAPNVLDVNRLYELVADVAIR